MLVTKIALFLVKLPMQIKLSLRLAPWVTVLALTACLGNDAFPVDKPGHAPAPNRAIVIFGVAVEGTWDAPKFAIQLQKYDFDKQTTTGNCLRSERLDVTVPAATRQVEYFVFDVTPGFFAGDAMFRGHTKPLAFEIPAGRVIYLGDFIYANDKKMDLRYDINAAMAVLKNSYPEVIGDPIVARTFAVPPLRMILCTP